MMEFEEFKKICKENYSGDNTCIYDDLFIDGLEINVYELGDGSFEISTLNEFYRQGEPVYEHEVIIGNYATLKQTYNALKEICKLNGVEME